MLISRAIFIATSTVLAWLCLGIAILMVAVSVTTSLRGDTNVNHAGLLVGAVVFAGLFVGARVLAKMVERMGRE